MVWLDGERKVVVLGVTLEDTWDGGVGSFMNRLICSWIHSACIAAFGC